MAGGGIGMIAQYLTNGEQSCLLPRKNLRVAMDLAEAEEALLLMKGTFDRRSIPFWLLCGTLLGAVRDGRFIDGDKDIDLGLYAGDLDRICPALAELRDIGFTIVRVLEDDSLVQVLWKTVYADLCLWRKADDGTWWCNDYFEPDDYFSKLRSIVFLGGNFRIPARAEEYLAERYRGKRWKRPDPSYKHAKFLHRKRRDP